MKVQRLLAALVVLTLAASVAWMPSATASSNRERAALFDHPSGTSGNEAGWTQLHRADNEIRATVHTTGLIPGGVYTFWWVVVPSGDPTDGVFVSLIDSTVGPKNGKATVHGQAAVDDVSIGDLPAEPIIPFVEMANPLTAVVRVEVAYHGQADEAGSSLDDWLTDFWTGNVELCSSFPGPGFNHCPIVQASQFAPS